MWGISSAPSHGGGSCHGSTPPAFSHHTATIPDALPHHLVGGGGAQTDAHVGGMGAARMAAMQAQQETSFSRGFVDNNTSNSVRPFADALTHHHQHHQHHPGSSPMHPAPDAAQNMAVPNSRRASVAFPMSRVSPIPEHSSPSSMGTSSSPMGARAALTPSNTTAGLVFQGNNNNNNSGYVTQYVGAQQAASSGLSPFARDPGQFYSSPGPTTTQQASGSGAVVQSLPVLVTYEEIMGTALRQSSSLPAISAALPPQSAGWPSALVGDTPARGAETGGGAQLGQQQGHQLHAPPGGDALGWLSWQPVSPPTQPRSSPQRNSNNNTGTSQGMSMVLCAWRFGCATQPFRRRCCVCVRACVSMYVS